MCQCNLCTPVPWQNATVDATPVPAESVELTVKLTASEYARLEAAWSGSGMQDTKTGFVKRAALAAVELLEGD